jgi:transposase
VLRNQSIEANYEGIIAELKLELERSKETIKSLEEALSTKDELLKKICEELRLANLKIEELKGIIKKLQSDRYGTSSEKEKSKEKDPEGNNRQSENKAPDLEKNKEEKSASENSSTDADEADKDELAEKRKRGGQRGNRGHGRRIPDGNPDVEYYWDIPEEDCKCKKCGKKYRKILKFRRVSHGIEIRITILHTMHVQEVYEKECNCDSETPELVVAPKPANIIYKSIFDTSTWCRMLALKYLTCIPVNRFNTLFAGNSYKIAPSTVLGGFEEILKSMMPLYDEIVSENQKETHFNADETRWCRMVDPDDNKVKLYWVWCFLGKRSVVYVNDSSRSKEVPKNHFKNTKEGYVTVDRFPSYNILTDKMVLCYCWQHLKRDFTNFSIKFSDLKSWAQLWIERIHEIEIINNSRNELFKQNKDYSEVQNELSQEVDKFFDNVNLELNIEGLSKEQLKILKSMKTKKAGYCVFVEHPEISMYNNAVEQEFRHVANARNNYNGSISEWGGTLATVVWTIFKSALMNDLEPISYLEAYLKEYAIKNSPPNNIQRFLPWNYKDFITIQQASG